MAPAHPVKAGLLAYACLEEPDALIALVRVCGGAPRATGGIYPENTRKGYRRVKAIAVPHRMHSVSFR